AESLEIRQRSDNVIEYGVRCTLETGRHARGDLVDLMSAVARAPDVTCGRVELMNEACRGVQDHALAVYRARHEIRAPRLRHGRVSLWYPRIRRRLLCKKRATRPASGYSEFGQSALGKVARVTT